MRFFRTVVGLSVGATLGTLAGILATSLVLRPLRPGDQPAPGDGFAVILIVGFGFGVGLLVSAAILTRHRENRSEAASKLR